MEEKRPKVGSAVLVEKDGKFLLGERNKENYNRYWVIPGGGVRWGETLKDAGIREIKEETNLDVEIVKFIGWKEIMNLPGNYHTVVFFHLARPKHMDLKPGDDLSKAGFFSIEEIKGMKIAESVKWVLQQAGFWK
jgi:ADP-ribose pyrophosphatase YjhB (NUDIX family)